MLGWLAGVEAFYLAGWLLVELSALMVSWCCRCQLEWSGSWSGLPAWMVRVAVTRRTEGKPGG